MRNTLPQGCWMVLCVVAALLPGDAVAGGFLEKVAKQVSAPVRAIVSGNIQDIPKAVIAPIAGPVVDKVATAVGGSIGQTLQGAAQNPTALQNLPNVQFLHAVLSIKALRASGVIHNKPECYQIAAKVASTVGVVSGNELQGSATQDLGNAACDTAITPSGPPAHNDISLPPEARLSLGTATGFAGNSFQIWPVAQCFVSPVPPFLNGGPFIIMSNFAALKWHPARGEWQQVGQLYLDGSGLFVMRNLLDTPPAQLGYSATGHVFLLNTPFQPGPVGHCT